MRQKFTKYERDGETGLDYAQARYYSSAQGRFTSVDPENAGADPENPQTWNGYAYALNNPTVFVDPDGLQTILYDINGKEIHRLEDHEANAGLFDRDWRRKNGHTFGNVVNGRREILQNGELIGYYENTCCDWLAGSRNEREVQQLVSGEAYNTRTVVGAVVNVATGGLTRGRTSSSKGAAVSSLSQAGKRRLAKRQGDIPRSARPTAQGYTRGSDGGRWWEYKDKNGNTKIVVEHPDGTVHVGTPKPQSLHRQGEPPKYYPVPGTGHVGDP